MAKYIANIELQDANEKDYECLFSELKKESFRDERNAERSEGYVIGKGIYSREGNLTIQEVNEAILRAADKTGKRCTFFVIRNKQTYNTSSPN